MDYKIFAPKKAVCEVLLPASKSISNRALILSALADSKDSLVNVARCNDTDAMLAALSDQQAATVNIGAAGTAMRFLTAFFAVSEGRTVALDGSERMHHRPIKILVDALRLCGADIEYLGEEGFPPLLIHGTKLKAQSVEIPGNVSSQYISALLMISPLIEGIQRIVLTQDIISRPYIAMTLELMRQFGVETKWEGNIISIPEGAKYHSTGFDIENDWSAASYWYQIQTLLPQSRITLRGLFAHSVQGDSAVADIYNEFGVIGNRCGKYLDLSYPIVNTSDLKLDLINNPDLAQTIVVTACLLGRHFDISGLQTLKIKETDRIEALRSELLKLGYVLSVKNDSILSWHGEMTAPSSNICIDTFDDHRMAMAFAPAATIFPGIVIRDIDVVRKSYPDYWKHLLQAGFQIAELG